MHRPVFSARRLLIPTALFAAAWTARADAQAGPNSGYAPNAPAAAPAQPGAAPQAAQQPKPESLSDLRFLVVHNKLADAQTLCDQLRAVYEDTQKIETDPRKKSLALFMACYCMYMKAQVLAIRHNLPAAETLLKEAQGYRTTIAGANNPKLAPTWLELDALTQGFIYEEEGRPDDAVKSYLQISDTSPKATSRLAVLEYGRGHIDQAKTWAYIHADDPTSGFVLAEAALKGKNLAAARQHMNRSLGQLQKAETTGTEYMPIYFCEAPHIYSLRAKLSPPVKKPAPKPAPAPAADPTPP